MRLIYWKNERFIHVNTPILTGLDCEGAGEMFGLSEGEEFFRKSTYLTVSGQLHAEILASALSRVYVLGPTFRAEKSHTARHLAEFWMLEAEWGPVKTLPALMDLVERCVRFTMHRLLETGADDLGFLEKANAISLLSRLSTVASTEFARMTYDEAIATLKRASQSFNHSPEWGLPLQTEHEKYLADVYCGKPVFVTDYPEAIKPFYMRNNEGGHTVAATDLLVPGIGELVGGSLREERLPILETKMRSSLKVPSDYDWYADLRRFGTFPHGGFGMGFERFIQFCTGMSNIRDVIPFSRFLGRCDY